MIENIPLINDLPEPFRTIVAILLLVIMVLVVSAVLRRILTWIIIRPLRRMAKRTEIDHDNEMLDRAIQPIRYIVIAVAILISVQILETGQDFDNFVANIARSMIIFAVLLIIFRVVDLFSPTSVRLAATTGLQIEERLLPFLRTAAKFVIIALGLVIILQEWGYDVSGLIAGLGLGGLAFSLAAQDTVSNLFGFTAIVSDNPFDVGEYIVADGVEGIVEHVGLRSTRIRRLDQAIVYMPNSRLANANILNWSRLVKRRMDFTLGVTYSSTSGELRVLLHRIREMLGSQELVDPETVTVYFVNFGNSSLDLMVRCYVLLKDWTEFTAETERLRLLIMDIVDELGMSIAFPSTSLYVENLPPIMTARDLQPESEQSPQLDHEERALMEGRIHETTERPAVSGDENVTGQQDEAD